VTIRRSQSWQSRRRPVPPAHDGCRIPALHNPAAARSCASGLGGARECGHIVPGAGHNAARSREAEPEFGAGLAAPENALVNPQLNPLPNALHHLDHPDEARCRFSWRQCTRLPELAFYSKCIPRAYLGLILPIGAAFRALSSGLWSEFDFVNNVLGDVDPAMAAHGRGRGCRRSDDGSPLLLIGLRSSAAP
jgi:hypothetical protein